MKNTRDRDGSERLWFEEGEVERIMETELRKASLLPSSSAPVVDLERFIERHLGAHLDQYAQLDPKTLGLTEFTAGAPPKISINRDLTGSALDEDETPPGILGRFRATLAHEAAHVLLHRCLFEFAAGNMSLFGPSNSAATLQRCLKRNASYRRITDWREYQANEGMAALLMPRSVFVPIAREHIARIFGDGLDVPDGQEQRVAGALAPVFAVSRQAAAIRLGTVGLLQRGQGRLA